MKQGIHPEYHEINVTRTDGKTVKMYSTVKKDLVLSTDFDYDQKIKPI